jgi:DNA repair photolyase
LDKKHVEISQDEYMEMLRRNRNLTLVKNVFENVLSRKSQGKMFNIVTKTWNPVTGCLYNCNYCWARQLATTKLRNSHRYSNGFKPMLNDTEFCVKFSKGDFVFVSDMGDLFGNFIPSSWIEQVLAHTKLFPNTYFLFLTKNPSRYHEFILEMPEKAILGVTIETNKDHILYEDKSKAPLPTERYMAMREIDWDKKMVSIEPVLDFDLELMSRWIEDILPFLVYIGYDNYANQLSEPLLDKTLKLIDRLSKNMLIIKKTIRPAWFETHQIKFGDANEQPR